jgi:hypothetical protein
VVTEAARLGFVFRGLADRMAPLSPGDPDIHRILDWS